MTVLACVLFALALDVCELCVPGETDAVLCPEHAKRAEEALERLEPELAALEPERRRRAVVELSTLNHAHENAPSLAPTRRLGVALSDADAKVRALAGDLLTDRQHPGLAVELLCARLATTSKEIDVLRRRPVAEAADPNDFNQVLEAMSANSYHASDLLTQRIDRGRVARALGRLGDERALEPLPGALASCDYGSECWLDSAYRRDVDGELASIAFVYEALRSLGTRPAGTVLFEQLDRIVAARRELERISKSLNFKPAKGLDKQAFERERRTLRDRITKAGVLADELSKRVRAEFVTLGEKHGFTAPPEAGKGPALWESWWRKNADKLPAARAAPTK